jgi:uncharacterized protein (DUF58 family)
LASRRKARPHTKIYREERERPTPIAVINAVDVFCSKVRLKSVAAAECAALLAWHAVDSGDRVGGLVFNDDRISIQTVPERPRSRTILNQVERSNRALEASSKHRPGPRQLIRRTNIFVRVA